MRITPQDSPTLGERCHDALVRAAAAKVDALRARKLAERTYDRILLSMAGKTVGEREARARTEATFIAVDDAALEAESESIIARARADGLQIEFEQWRSKGATERAEMQMR